MPLPAEGSHYRASLELGVVGNGSIAHDRRFVATIAIGAALRRGHDLAEALAVTGRQGEARAMFEHDHPPTRSLVGRTQAAMQLPRRREEAP